MTTALSPQAMEELLDHSVDVITVLDESGVIQYESPSLSRMFGYDPADLIGDNVFEYVHPEDREVALDTFHELIESSTGHSTDSIELRFQHNDGEWVWIETRGANEKGSEIGGYVVTSRDISARKEFERNLKRERDRLERLVSVVTHDLRNPLNVAQGQLDFAHEECESDHLEAVARSHDRIAALIEDIQTLVRNNEAGPQLDAIVLRETIETCWQNVDTRQATLTIESEHSFLADESQCQRLLENLMRNAVEHGGDAVTITVGDLENGFYIEDDGRGLPDGDPDALLEDGVTTKATGTGLGLSIVSEIVADHGWTLTVAEGEDGGARFEIRGVTLV